MARRRQFGRIRKLPSGRFQARYLGPDGIDHPAPDTFRTKTEAAAWLSKQEAEILNDAWINPDAGKVLLRDYGATWIEERPKLAPRTVQGYRGLLKNHIAPTLGALAVNEIKDAQVRRWRKKLVDAEVGEATIARAYQLLKSIMNTAIEDELIRRNPCRIKGGAQNDTPERPTLTVEQVFNVAGEVPLRYRLLVLFATFASMRWGEMAAIQRGDVDLTAYTINVQRSAIELDGEPIRIGPPKSAAGQRRISFPEELLPYVEYHLETYVGPDASALVFASWEGGYLRRANFNKIWTEARNAVALGDVHVHDLRHTGNSLAADTGAPLKDLMQRMGHSTVRAALIYQHKTPGRDRKIAKSLGELIKEAERPKEDPPDASRAPNRRSGT